MGEGEENGADVGGRGGGEKKVMKFSFTKTKPSNRRPPLPPKAKEAEVVEYVTSVDAEAGIVVTNPRAGSGVRVVPKLENSWRPEKRMKNIVMEGDVTKSTEETFEMETMDAGPKANVQYGLTLMDRVRVGVEGGAEAPLPSRHMSLKELEDQKLREDLTNLPEEATLDQYEELPVEEFGEALLRGMGWEKGKPIGRNSIVVVEPAEFVRRQGMLGLGATPAPPKETNKKYIKPGETREKKREEYIKPRESRESRREEYSKPEESREKRREEESRELYRREEHIKPRESREKHRREEYSKSEESREKRRHDKRSDRHRR